MKLEHFKIGNTFTSSAGYQWLCTDKGTRTISAIRIEDDKDKSWYIGPPYAMEEIIFDEVDMKSCYSNNKDLIIDRAEELFVSCHPGIESTDFFKMMGEKDRKYPYKKLIKRERVGINGEIYNPYSAIKKEDGWHIKVYEIFLREFSEIHENEFVKLKLSQEIDVKNRKDKLGL